MGRWSGIGKVAGIGFALAFAPLCPRSYPVLAMASVSAAPADTAGPATIEAPLLGEADELRLRFEPRSNRLLPEETERLDRLASLVHSQPASQLLILVPATTDPAMRHFVASRLAVVERELAARELVGEKRYATGAESALTLCLVAASSPAVVTAVDTLRTAASAGQPVEQQAPAVSAPATSVSQGAPVPLLPSQNVLPEKLPESEPARMAEGPAPVVSATQLTEELWIAASGRLLRDVLKEWGDRAGWTVVWQSSHEYPLDASATFSGDFTAAAVQLFEGFAEVAPAPLAHFYKGNRVLVVLSGEGR